MVCLYLKCSFFYSKCYGYSNCFIFRIECFNIGIADDDPFFTNPTQKCMHFVRSDIGPVPKCDTGNKLHISFYIENVHLPKQK